MMLANVYTKTILDRWKGMAIAAGGMALMLWFAMAAYNGIDTDFFDRMPEFWRALANIPEGGGVTGLAYSAMFASYGALAVGSLALSMGAASIAGEERDGTIGLLLANPVSRVRVLLSKLGSLVTVVAGGVLVLWGAAYLVPVLVGTDTGGMDIAALMVHLVVVSVFFGAMAMAIGAWTGNRGLASGATAGVMVVSFIVTGLLPLVSGWESVPKAFPWYYYDAAEPLINGIGWFHLSVLLAGIVVLLALAVIGVRRRDLEEHSVAVTMLDRLRANPRTRKIMEKVAGSARVSGITAKAVSDHQTLMIVVSYVMVLMALFIGPFYRLVDDMLVDFAKQFPDAILSMVGFADLTTPEGWYQTEVFSLSLPIAFLAVTLTMGAKALAGEEADRTMGLLLSNPVSRSRVVLGKAAAMVGVVLVVAFLTFAGTIGGSLIANLGMGYWNVAATSLLGMMLALVFGALALAIGAATGRVKTAVYGSAGVALTAYVANVYFPLSDSLAGFAKWSPFYYFLAGDPLNQGMNWVHFGVLAGLAALCFAAAVPLFQRRDLRQTG
ncbi:MAG: ABC transporter permease [Actinobacteria bacterium]|nr:ABC transporter permease [Actinomycetota bacterium]